MCEKANVSFLMGQREYFNRSGKKWLSVLIGERKLPKKKMCHLSWDKLKKKTYHLKRDGGSSN